MGILGGDVLTTFVIIYSRQYIIISRLEHERVLVLHGPRANTQKVNNLHYDLLHHDYDHQTSSVLNCAIFHLQTH